MLKLTFAGAAALALLAGHGNVLAASAPVTNQKILTRALNQYLAVSGDLCLGKFDWPIDVSPQDFLDRTRDALQMPVLEKLNLVTVSPGTVKRTIDDVEQVVKVNQYALSAIGKIYYLNRKSQVALSTGEVLTHDHDLCGGRVKLDKLVRWDPPAKTDAGWETTLHYTYRFTPTWWAQAPEVQEVFPVFPILIKGQGQLKLDQRFRWDGRHWVAETAI